jgi:hypothetical protein
MRYRTAKVVSKTALGEKPLSGNVKADSCVRACPAKHSRWTFPLALVVYVAAANRTHAIAGHVVSWRLSRIVVKHAAAHGAFTVAHGLFWVEWPAAELTIAVSCQTFIFDPARAPRLIRNAICCRRGQSWLMTATWLSKQIIQ